MLFCCFTPMEIWGRSVKVTSLFMGRLRPPMQLHITSTKVHILSPVTLLRISEMRNESKWPDRVVSLGPLALKSDTEHDVYAKFQCSLNALFCDKIKQRFANISENFTCTVFPNFALC